MSWFEAVYAHLDLVHLQGSYDFFGKQNPVREEHLSEGVIGQTVIDATKFPVKEGLTSRNQESQSLHILEFAKYRTQLPERKFLIFRRADIAVSAPEVASISDLQFQISERRLLRFLYGWSLPLKFFGRQKAFAEGIFKKDMVTSFNWAALFTGRSPEKVKAGLIELIELIRAHVIHTWSFEPFQSAIGSKKISHFLLYLTRLLTKHLQKAVFHSNINGERLDHIIHQLQKVRRTVLAGEGVKKAMKEKAA